MQITTHDTTNRATVDINYAAIESAKLVQLYNCLAILDGRTKTAEGDCPGARKMRDEIAHEMMRRANEA